MLSWFKSYGDFAEWVYFAYWWSCSGKGLSLQPAAGLFYYICYTPLPGCNIGIDRIIVIFCIMELYKTTSIRFFTINNLTHKGSSNQKVPKILDLIVVFSEIITFSPGRQ